MSLKELLINCNCAVPEDKGFVPAATVQYETWHCVRIFNRILIHCFNEIKDGTHKLIGLR